MSEDTQFDPGQRAAVDVRKNAVVSAGAGSGKTTVLSERFAQLVERDGLPLDSILTLTFTKKAAAEMYSRIYRRLAASPSPAVKEQLLNFDRARIMTLDAFCASIVRGGSQGYGVSPDFSVDEARLERIADETAVEFMMDHRGDSLVRRLVAVYSFDRVRKELFADFALELCSLSGSPDYSGGAERQIAFLENRLRKLTQKLEDILADMRRVDAPSSPLKTYQDIQAVLAAIPQLDAGAGLERLADQAATLAGLKTINRNATNPALVELKEPVDCAKKLAEELSSVIAGLECREDLLATGRYLDEFSARFIEKKRRQGLLSFRDIAELAVDILTRDTALRSYYKGAIRAIMIDEFQDNNELQKSLLYLLAERTDRLSAGIPVAGDLDPSKLFFVGDEKQSIYRFRGADVSVFRKLSDELAPDDSPALQTNYRSTPTLISFFNAFFPGVFGQAEEAYEARFEPILVPPSDPEKPAPAFPVEFHVLDEDGEESETISPIASEAIAAAERIARGKDNEEFGYGDVAILFRTTGPQHEYEKALRLFGIPYLAADPRGLFTEAPANDLYAYLTLLLFPGDRNAWATVLRSPFVSLGDDAVARILLDAHAEPFSEVPGNWFASEIDRRRYFSARDFWVSLRDCVDTIGSAALVARLWYETGYRNDLLSNNRSIAYLNHFDLFYKLALNADSRRLPLSAFLDELAPLIGTPERVEGDDLPEGVEAVRLMTIHKSKGLQFPVVVLAGLGRRARTQKNDKPWYLHQVYGPTINFKAEDAARKEKTPNYFYEEAKQAEEARETAELRRLLYVAATRAEQRLLLFTSVKPKKADRDSLKSLTGRDLAKALLTAAREKNGTRETNLGLLQDLVAAGLSGIPGDLPPSIELALIPPLTYGMWTNLKPKTATRQTGTAPETGLSGFYAQEPLKPASERKLTSSPSAMERAALHETQPLALELPALGVDALIEKGSLEAAFGTLCHRAIECALLRIPFTAPAPVSSAFSSSGLSGAEQELIAAEAQSLAKAFLDSELGKRAVNSPRLKAEFTFILPLRAEAEKTCIVRGTMDLVFEDGADCLIVDFKTDRRLDPSQHTIQMACYRRAIGAFSDAKPASFLYYLRGAKAVQVDTEIEAEQLYRLAVLTEEQSHG